jgi:hypothetical protein
MARIRTVKPEFFTSEDIVSLSPFARLLYIALWCEADKEGRMYWKPKTFKMRYLPADEINIEELCNELITAGLVVLYGDGLAYVPGFAKHQHINPRETASSIPAPDASLTREARVKTRVATVSDAQGGREGKGRIDTRDASPPPDGVDEQVWQDFQKLRKAKKAPVTQTVVDGIRLEAAKAGLSLGDALAVCCKRGWQGFDSTWVTNGLPKTSGGLLAGAI